MMGPHRWRFLWVAFVAAFGQGCLVTQTMVDRLIDTDNDGYWEVGYRDGADCDDDDPLVNPAAGEVCFDQLDNDCDGAVDEDGVGDQTIFIDRDGDGVGDASAPIASCFLLTGYATVAGDCDDARADVFPAAVETCNGRDDDCDGEVDDDAPGTTWYRDEDEDGYGDPLNTRVQCESPRGFVDRGGDCADDDPAVHPNATDPFYDGADTNCDGADDFDQDGDGWPHAAAGTPSPDCDDLLAVAWPGAPEVWYDGVDQDCDPTTEWDQDGDGFDAEVAGGEDCDDTNLLIRPDAVEVWYDGVDGDCDPSTEWDQDGDGASRVGAPVGTADDCDDADAHVGRPSSYWPDLDADGFGAPGAPLVACAPQGAWAPNDADCDDADPTLNPETPWFTDADADGFGDALAGPTLRCAPPPSGVRIGGDCDDLRADVHPGEPEVCDDVDQDCDVHIDEGWLSTQYPDADGDGFAADGAAAALRCPDTPGWSPFQGDCDPQDPTVHPGAAEVCDGVDAACNGDADEGLVLLHADADGDGRGARAGTLVCPGAAGFVANDEDCDDTREDVYRGAAELCDHVDNDCDAPRQIDEGVTVDLYADLDGDGWGGELALVGVCAAEHPALVEIPGDCDDARGDFFPGAPEACDHLDGDCSGTDNDAYAVRGFFDADCDGQAADATPVRLCADEVVPDATAPCDELAEQVAPGLGDCDDTRADVFLGAPERCDHVDNDCDAPREVDEGVTVNLWSDADGDGWGVAMVIPDACPQDFPDLAVRGGDCDDLAASTFPGAPEDCDHVDTNCVVDDEPYLVEGWLDQDCDGQAADLTPVGLCAWEAVPDPTDGDTCDDPAERFSTTPGDCDDGRPTVFAGAPERCDHLDNDCDPRTPVDAGLRQPLWTDSDRDGFGGALVFPSECAALYPELAVIDGDCDDRAASVNPAAVDVCNGRVDDDCDGIPENGPGGQRAWLDEDGDGYGGVEAFACAPFTGFSQRSGDCADRNPSRYPGAPEQCNQLDDDCDSVADEGVVGVVYADVDLDGYGAGPGFIGCVLDADVSTVATDCDDVDAAVYPGAEEACDHVDGNCNRVDDEPYVVEGWLDQDCDGQPQSPLVGVGLCDTDMVGADGVGCDHPGEQVVVNAVPVDCDDSTADRQSAVSEALPHLTDNGCDGVDNDCDGETDEGPPPSMTVCADAKRWESEDGRVYLKWMETGFERTATWLEGVEWCADMGYHMWWPDRPFDVGGPLVQEVDMLVAYGLIQVVDVVHLGLEMRQVNGTWDRYWVDRESGDGDRFFGFIGMSQFSGCRSVGMEEKGLGTVLAGFPSADLRCAWDSSDLAAVVVCELD
jgi:hypothetical protein